MEEIKVKTPALKREALGLETITGKPLEHRREPRTGEDEEVERDAGPSAGRQPGQEARSVEALPPPSSLVPLGPLIAQDPWHVEGPDLHGAPGRETREDAEEGHTPQVAELAVIAGEPPVRADRVG